MTMKKLVMFDMDGVLFDSMKGHAKAWVRTMSEEGYDFPEALFYEKEGMTGRDIISLMVGCRRGEQVHERIYRKKAAYFEEFPPAPPMPGALEAVRAVNGCGVTAIVVTGSGQKHLMDRIGEFYPGLFRTEWMVSALDGTKGKPSPEPYLAGLRKAGVKAEDAVVVENAPLGVMAGKAAGCLVVAVNTGPLPDSCLTDAGADLLFHSMDELACSMKEILTSGKYIR